MTLHKPFASPLAALLTAILCMAACANPDKPDGGPYDETPPSVVGSSPKEFALNSHQKRIAVYFSEYVKLDNAAEKVVISPPQIDQPEIRASGKKIYVELKDTLKANTTYTIDFSDAIKDNNEGNPLGSYAFVFSTGETIDTMEVSGKVLNAQDLEPVKGILVGLHSNLNDSAFVTSPLEKIGRTDATGHFVIKGVAPGKYRIYALNDAESDFEFHQKSEDIAFTSDIIVPSSEPATRQDTTWIDSVRIDTIKTVAYTRFMPDDIVLRSFKETQTSHSLLKTERKTPYSFTLYFTAPTAEPPKMKGLNFDERDAFLIHGSAGNDTITYWIRDTALVAKDTLEFALTYLETDDSTGLDTERTDTLEMVSRTSYAKTMRELNDKMEQWQKRRDRAAKRGKKFNERPPRQWIRMRYSARGSIAPDENVGIQVNEPLATVDTSRIHLMLAVDSLWEERPMLITRDSASLLSYTVYGEWRNGQKYKLQIDSAAFTSIYGNNNIRMELNLDVPAAEAFASLFVTLSNYDNGQAYVQLLKGDKPFRTVKASGDHADFFYITPGKYYLRMFVDQNGNGEWDTGLFSEQRQPEPVYYYPGEIELRASWDTDQDWNVRSTPLARQKPLAITKQKAERKRETLHRNADRLAKKQKGEQRRQRNRR